MPRIYETSGVLTKNDSTGRMIVRIISPGPGSAGEYPAETISKAVEEKKFPAGTHMYLDHPTQEDRINLPERSVTRLAAVLESDAYLTADGAAEAPAKVYSTYREFLTEAADAIGVSIAADGIVTNGVVEELTEVKSIDFVTKAGRGGQIVEVLESAYNKVIKGPEKVHEEVNESTYSDLNRYLNSLIEQVYGYDAYVIDFDESFVFFRVWTGETSSKEYRQAYSRNGVNVALSGEREEVQRETKYAQVNESVSPGNIPPLPQEETMVDITEAEHTRLQEADRVAEGLKEENHALRQSIAESIVGHAFNEAGVEAPKGRAKLVEEAMALETFDTNSFTQTVNEAVGEYVPREPEVSGFGKTTPVEENSSGRFTYEDFEKEILSITQEGR